MNDKILRALMQLIALVAQYNKSTFHSQAFRLIKTYLEQNQGSFNYRTHLKQFLGYFDAYLQGSRVSTENKPVNTGIDEYLVHDLCNQLNIELPQEDRIVLFLSFLELINFDREVTSQENDFAAAIAKEFKIDQNDYLNALGFIFGNPPTDMLSSDCLIIGNIEPDQTDELEGSWIEKNKPANDQLSLFLNKPLLDGTLYVLQLKNVNFFALRYLGTDDVYLNKKKIVPGKFYTLRLYDALNFKDNESVSYNTINALFRSEKQALKLQLHGRSVSFVSSSKKRKDCIHPFSFSEESGNLIGIIGPIKTTELFFKCTTGLIKGFEGEISLNNYSVKTEYYKIFKYIGYIPEESIFDPEISVFNNVYLNVRLYYPRYSRERLEKMTDTILVKYQIQDIRNVVPSKAHSDEFTILHAHLLNFALALVSEPVVILFSSPLEGLSSSDSLFLLQLIAKESVEGRIIFFSSQLPNPAIFKQADKIWIFDDQGYLIYNGQPAEAFDYFYTVQHNFVSLEKQCPYCGTINPDFIFQIIQQKNVDENGFYTVRRKVSPQEWNQYYKEHIEKDIVKADPKKVLPFLITAIPGIEKQYHVFLNKIISTRFSNIRKIGAKLLLAPLVALVIAFLLRHDWSFNYTYGQNPNIHLYIICSMLFLFMFGFVYGVQEARHEKVFISHYHLKTQSCFSYLNATFTWLFLCSVIVSFLYTLIGNAILQIEGFFINYLLIFHVTFLMAGALGILFSTFFKREFNVYVLSAVFLIFNVVFCGVAIDFKNLPRNFSDENAVPMLAEFSFLRWSFEALTVEQVKNNSYERYFYPMDKNMGISYYYATILIPALQSQINNIDIRLHVEQTNLVNALHDEISQIHEMYADVYPFEFINELKPERLTPELLAETSDYLTYAQMQFSDLYQKGINQHNELEKYLRKSMGIHAYQRFVSHNYNSYLYHFCNHDLNQEPVIFDGVRFNKKINPLFLLPVSNLGKAHLYAPSKRYNGFYYETFWFNFLILWTFALLIFVTNLIVFQRTYR